MGKRWEAIKTDLGGYCFEVAAGAGWGGGILLVGAIAALPIRLAYFMRSGSWPLSICDGQQFFTPNPICSISTDWHGFDWIVGVLISSMDMSLAMFIVAIFLFVNGLVLAFLGSSLEASASHSRERRLKREEMKRARKAEKEERRKLAQASR